MPINWYIGGLWPVDKDWVVMSFCNVKFPFKLCYIEHLVNELSELWYDLREIDQALFWEREYIEYGTCAKRVESLTLQQQYFEQAIELAHRFNITAILNQSRIYPDDHNTHDQVILKGWLSLYAGMKDIAIRCLYSDGCLHPVLSEVYICFSKEFQVIDCPQKFNACGDWPVLYLKSPQRDK